MAVQNDVVVYDDEFKMIYKYISKYCDGLINVIDTYKKNVDYILEAAIRDEKISQELNNLANNVVKVKSGLETIKKDACKLCLDYLYDIDKADDYLY